MVNNGWLVVTGTWLDYDFPYELGRCWEFHHPNWRTPSFFRGVPPTSIRLRLNMNRIEFCHIVCWVQSSKAQFSGESQWAFVMDQLETPQEQVYNLQHIRIHITHITNTYIYIQYIVFIYNVCSIRCLYEYLFWPFQTSTCRNIHGVSLWEWGGHHSFNCQMQNSLGGH